MRGRQFQLRRAWKRLSRALNRGDYRAAYAEFSKLADGGDDKAMITIWLFFHEGKGLPQDYSKAMDWYLRAFKLSSGDAYSNIGVLYRDGLGVPSNRKIAYDLFLIAHMRGLGGEATQHRAGRSLDREVAELPKEEIRTALCYTEEFVRAYVLSRGKASPQDAALRATPSRPALRDKDWWLNAEREHLDVECSK